MSTKPICVVCQKIMAFPTLRWYSDGEAVAPDYKMDRTVNALMAFAKRRLELRGKIFENVGKKKEEEEEEEDEEGEEEADDEVEEEEAEETVMHDMREKCRSAGHTYGSSNSQFSQNEGSEFQDFIGLRVDVSPACRSAVSNARGKYNSFYAPCEFRFHVISNTNAASSGGNSLQLSSSDCSPHNVYTHPGAEDKTTTTMEDSIMDYVRAWPDECVGDYRRCYSVAKPLEAKIFLPHFCRNNWEIPASVTHISVSCQEDKLQVLKKQAENENMGNLHLAQMDRHHREKVTVVLLLVVLTCCCGWAVLCLGYTYVVVPYLKAMKKSKSDPDLQSLVAVTNNTAGHGNGKQSVV